MAKARVLIADDHEVVRQGILSLVKMLNQFEVCGEAMDGRDAVQKAKELRPDIVIIDIGMAAEPRAVREDDALGVFRHLDISKDLVGHAVCVRNRSFRHWKGARVVRVLAAGSNRDVILQRENLLDVFFDRVIDQREHVVSLRFLEP